MATPPGSAAATSSVSAPRPVLRPGPEEAPEAVLAAARDDVDVEVRDALAHDVVLGDERALGARGRPGPPTAMRCDLVEERGRRRRRAGRAGSRRGPVAPRACGPGTADGDRGTRPCVGRGHDVAGTSPATMRQKRQSRHSAGLVRASRTALAGGRVLALEDHHLAPEVADLFAALVEAARLDRHDPPVGLARRLLASRAPWSRRRWCRRGTWASGA